MVRFDRSVTCIQDSKCLLVFDFGIGRKCNIKIVNTADLKCICKTSDGKHCPYELEFFGSDRSFFIFNPLSLFVQTSLQPNGHCLKIDCCMDGFTVIL